MEDAPAPAHAPPARASSGVVVVNTETASEKYYKDVLHAVLKRLGWKNKADGPPAAGTDIVW